MLFALGAASSAIDFLQQLTSSKTSPTQATGLVQDQSNIFDVSSNTTAAPSATPGSGSAAGGGAQISPETMSALLEAQSQSSSSTQSVMSPSNALKDLFGQIDANGDGQITKSEFENALGAGGTNVAQADSVFSKLDSNGDGSVSLGEMGSALKGGGHHHAHAHVAASNQSSDNASGNAGGSSSDPLMQALSGDSTTSVTNSDGSVTTTVTYADGSTVTTTSAATPAAAGNATSSYNSIEQLIQRQANAVSAQGGASLSVSA